MKSKQTMFFATFEDLKKILVVIELNIDIEYFLCGSHENSAISNYKSSLEIPNLGYAFVGDWNKTDSYLVTSKYNKVNVRTVQQTNGSTKFIVDQMINNKSIQIKFGGIYNDNTIVAGRIGTISEDADSTLIYNYFCSKIKKEFRKFGMFYVGFDAQDKSRNGWRLVTNTKMPLEYDLQLN